MHITRGPPVARPVPRNIMAGCCSEGYHDDTSLPACEAAQVKVALRQITRRAPGAATTAREAAAAASAGAAGAGAATAAREAAAAAAAAAAGAATASASGASTIFARVLQHRQDEQQKQRRQRRHHHHHLRIMPPNAGCPIPPRPSHPSLASRSFPRSTSLPLWQLTPPPNLPHSAAPYLPSSPVSAAAPALLSTCSVSASAKESPSSSNRIHSHGFPSSHSSHIQHSQSATVVPRRELVRRYSSPALGPNLSNSPCTSPVSSPKTNPRGRFESIADQLSSSESEDQVRPGLSPKSSCFNPKLESPAFAATRKLVRRVSFSGIVQMRRFIDLHADADKYCSDTDGRYSNAIYSGQWCGDAIPCSTREQQQPQQHIP
ncbi:unnamed protein product [Closterium sp. NIES-53]